MAGTKRWVMRRETSRNNHAIEVLRGAGTLPAAASQAAQPLHKSFEAAKSYSDSCMQNALSKGGQHILIEE